MMTGRDPWTILAGLPAWQVLEIPRLDHDDAPVGRDDGSARRAQALTAAFSAGSPLAVGWVREQAGGPVRVICAGPAMAAAEGGDVDVLALPSGARGKRLGDGQAGDLLAVMPSWTQTAAVADVLLARPPEPGAVRPSLEDGLLSVWLGPFAWLLIAEPADAGTISAMAGRRRVSCLGRRGFPARWRGWPPAGPRPATMSSARPFRRGCGAFTCMPAPPPSRTRRGCRGCCARPSTWPGCRTPWFPGRLLPRLPSAGTGRGAGRGRRCWRIRRCRGRLARSGVMSRCGRFRRGTRMRRRSGRCRRRSSGRRRCRNHRSGHRPSWWPPWRGCRSGRCRGSGWCCSRGST